MTSKKTFTYDGILCQPKRVAARTDYVPLWEALSERHCIMHATPLDPDRLPTRWLRKLSIKLIQVHEPGCSHLTIPLIEKMNRRDLFAEFIRLTHTYVGCFRKSENPGRKRDWTLSQQMILLTRMEMCLFENKQYKWSVERAAKSLLPFYPQVTTEKHLARAYRSAVDKALVITENLRAGRDKQLEDIFWRFTLEQVAAAPESSRGTLGEPLEQLIKLAISQSIHPDLTGLVDLGSAYEAAWAKSRFSNQTILAESVEPVLLLYRALLEENVLLLWYLLGMVLEFGPANSSYSKFVDRMEQHISEWVFVAKKRND